LGRRSDPLSLNRYAYCFNNPLIYYDPTGHAPAGSGPGSFFRDGAGWWFVTASGMEVSTSGNGVVPSGYNADGTKQIHGGLGPPQNNTAPGGWGSNTNSPNIPNPHAKDSDNPNADANSGNTNRGFETDVPVRGFVEATGNTIAGNMEGSVGNRTITVSLANGGQKILVEGVDFYIKGDRAYFYSGTTAFSELMIRDTDGATSLRLQGRSIMEVWKLFEDLQALTDDILGFNYMGWGKLSDIERALLDSDVGKHYLSGEDGYFKMYVYIRTKNSGGSKPNGTDLVSTLLTSEKTTTIMYVTHSDPYTSNYASSYNGTWLDYENRTAIYDTWIFYDPKSNPYGYPARNTTTNRVARGEKPAYISLGHELIHALGNATGTYFDNSTERDWTYINAQGVNVTISTPDEELATIGLIPGRRITENMLLQEHGFDPRGSYILR